MARKQCPIPTSWLVFITLSFSGSYFEQVSAVSYCGNVTQWKVQNGGNGHWYAGVRYSTTLFWSTAKADAEMLGGYLATVTSLAEFQVVNNVAGQRDVWGDSNQYGGPWLGGYQDRSAPDYSEPSGGWRWVTGEPWFAGAWYLNPGQPNNAAYENGQYYEEDYLNLISGNPTWPYTDRHWNDGRMGRPDGFCAIVEWHNISDCNANSVVDSCEIAAGTVPDNNQNGIPDSCEPKQSGASISSDIYFSSSNVSVLERFAFPECVENRSWGMIAATYKDAPYMFSSGGLGALMDDDFEVYACFQGHPCLSLLRKMQPVAYTEAMCYLYSEKRNTFFPWGLKSEINFCYKSDIINSAPSILQDQLQLAPSLPVIAPFWTSTKQITDVDVGYMPSQERKETTLIMALRFPYTSLSSPGSKRQWLLNYGQVSSPGPQHWIWEASDKYDTQTAVYKNNVLHIGIGWMSNNVNIVGYGNSDGSDDIPAGKVITICTVSQSDDEYILYINGSRPSTYRLSDGTAATSKKANFQYTTSMMVTGTSPDKNYQLETFGGTIHETRLYASILSPEQVWQVSNELYDKYTQKN